MDNLRRTTKTNGSNTSPIGFKPQGGVTDRYCVKCKTWMPSKGGKQIPGTKLWICAQDHSKPKDTTPADMPAPEDA